MERSEVLEMLQADAREISDDERAVAEHGQLSELLAICRLMNISVQRNVQKSTPERLAEWLENYDLSLYASMETFINLGMLQMAERYSAAQSGLWRAKRICLPYLLSAGDEQR